MVGDKLVRDVINWLSPADPWVDHSIIWKFRHKGTTEWFIQGKMFSEWKSSRPGHLLWIHGKCLLLLSPYAFAETDRFPSYSWHRKGSALVS